MIIMQYVLLQCRRLFRVKLECYQIAKLGTVVNI